MFTLNYVLFTFTQALSLLLSFQIDFSTLYLWNFIAHKISSFNKKKCILRRQKTRTISEYHEQQIANHTAQI